MSSFCFFPCFSSIVTFYCFQTQASFRQVKSSPTLQNFAGSLFLFMMDKECMFRSVSGKECQQQQTNLIQNVGFEIMQTIIEASKIYDGDIHTRLEPSLIRNEHLKVSYHKNYFTNNI